VGIVQPQLVSAASTQYVFVRVDQVESGLRQDPTADTVELGFVVGSTAPASWVTADWETDATGLVPIYRARCLIGPDGAVTLPPGIYGVWVRVTASPEKPVLAAGPLRIV
jgi:hypothetical protein